MGENVPWVDNQFPQAFEYVQLMLRSLAPGIMDEAWQNANRGDFGSSETKSLLRSSAICQQLLPLTGETGF